MRFFRRTPCAMIVKSKLGVSILILILILFIFEDSSMVLCKVKNNLQNQPLLIGVTYSSKQYVVCN